MDVGVFLGWLLPVVVLVVVCVKAKLRWGGFALLLLGAWQGLVISAVLLFANPLPRTARGSVL